MLPSSIDGLWSGEYVAQEEKVHWPELFLYSKSDFYLPYEHLEQEVLAKRKALGRDYRTVRQVYFYGLSSLVSRDYDDTSKRFK